MSTLYIRDENGNFVPLQAIQGTPGRDGDPGVHIGTEKPDNPNINLWIDPEGEDDPLPYYTPSVSPEGVISWSNNYDLTNPDPVDVRGPVGPVGESGVYLGPEAPTNEDVDVWINPDEEPVEVYTKAEVDKAIQGGSYELIETITVEEEAVVINRTQEPDGTPYNFKSLQVFITVAENVSTTYSFGLRLYSNSTKIGESYVATIPSHTAPQYYIMKCKPEYGRWLTEWSNWVKTKNIVTILNQDYYVGWREYAIEQYPTINQIQTSNKLPVGIIIEIWGVRA